MPEFEPLHPMFGVQVHGVDLTRALDDATFAPIAVLHRGRPWDVSEPRHMKRATVADDGYTQGVLVAA